LVHAAHVVVGTPERANRRQAGEDRAELVVDGRVGDRVNSFDLAGNEYELVREADVEKEKSRPEDDYVDGDGNTNDPSDDSTSTAKHGGSSLTWQQ